MATEVLDIVDTAVKIGLGALISGVSTYYVTSFKYKHEYSSYILDKKLSIVEGCVKDIDEFMTSFSDFMADVDGVRKQFPDVSKLDKDNVIHMEVGDHLSDSDEKFCGSRAARANAISKLRLIGLNVEADVLYEFEKLEREIREIVIFNEEIPNQLTISAWINQIKDIKHRFFDAVSKHYVS